MTGTTCAWSVTRGRRSIRSPGPPSGYLTGFAAEYPHATVVKLMRNYRSTPEVVDCANRLAQGRTGRGRGGRAGRRAG